jgi:hypothetical protein
MEVNNETIVMQEGLTPCANLSPSSRYSAVLGGLWTVSTRPKGD